MAKISNTTAYPLQTASNVSLDDMVIITEDRSLETKNLKLSTLLGLQTGVVTFEEVTKEITAAEMLDLHINPVTLVPAKGGNTFVLPLTIAVKLNYGGVAFDFQPGDFISITTADLILGAAGYFGRIGAGNFFNSTVDVVSASVLGSNTMFGFNVGSGGLPLLFYGTGNTAATQGDSTVTVTVQFTQIKI
tara:strand:+ start:190 stop:759 length:570 start_codon:yes stop_codon:yes gene_type:complete